MMIRTFAELDDLERKELYEFLKKFGKNWFYKDYEEMIKVFSGGLFNQGTTYYSYWLAGEPKGTLGVITKEIAVRKEIFMTNVYADSEEVVNLLIERGLVDIRELCPCSVKLGLRDDRFKVVVENIGFALGYSAVILRYEGREVERVSLAVRELDLNTAEDFRIVHNEAFLTSPNGAVLEKDDMSEVLEQYGGNLDKAGIIYQGDRPVGMYQLTLKDDIAWIEVIAVVPERQSQGWGRDILRYCLWRLKDRDLIKLIVMSSNKLAYDFYFRHGFIKEEVLSNWYACELS